jgi:aryl-alcohol dehydrogenase-like predicted oxidoreductase
LTAQGKVLYTGVSEWTAEQITDAAAIGKQLGLRKLISNQPIYNMFERYERGVIRACEQEGMGQVVFSKPTGSN